MDTRYRNLTTSEIEQLKQAGNYAEDWSAIRVADPFCVECLRNNNFYGRVTLGVIGDVNVCDGDLTLREGICHSTLRDVTLGDHPVVHNVRMLSGYSIGNNVLLFNLGNLTCTADPKQVAWLEPMNENGGRRILPFGGMTIGDAYMWARYRGHHTFTKQLEQFTYNLLQSEESRYGRIGDHCVVKNTTTMRNVIVCSSAEDPTRIDGSIALCDGVVGYGCTLEHGVIAERFLLGEHVHLEFGLRLNDTVVGDNSTLARCEVGNSIIFPAHEQHHNNSFLIAGLIMGQSNIAAGGTIGSNHNSRTADNELAAGRGFWPGLCCSFKHSSRFASYCLLAKADYPSELDITLPFALVNNNVSKDRLEVMPAYWWMYNMYAMDRNSKKFAKRDKRVIKAQHVEFDNLAPDTAEEIFRGMKQLRAWMAASNKALPLDKGEYPEITSPYTLPLGKGEYPEGGKGSFVLAQGQEKSKRPTVVLKAKEGLKAYEEMLVFYAMKNLDSEKRKVESGKYETDWVNIGGQLVTKPDMEQLIADVENGTIGSWQQLHERMDSLWVSYPAQRKAHAYGVLCRLAGVDDLNEEQWQHYQKRYNEILKYIEEQKAASRKKDDVNPFRRMTYWDDAERDAVLNS